MNFTRVLIGALVITLPVIGREYVAAGAATTPEPSFELASPTVSNIPVRPRTGADEDVPRMDRYGNEVEEAVGDYRVDATGDLYEAHSPDTEVTRLGPPGT